MMSPAPPLLPDAARVEQLELPLHGWDDGMELRARDGARLKKWGSVREMSAMLFGLDRDACYLLLEEGEVEGFKLGSSRNSHYKVDLLSAWEYRARTYGR